MSEPFPAPAQPFVLRGGTVLSMDPAMGDLPSGDVLVEDGRIAAVAPELEAEGAAVVDVTGKVVMPGFVDSHRHVWETSLNGRSADMSLNGYFGWILAQVGPAFTPEEVHASTLLGAAEALDAGVTTIFDWCNATNSPEHADASVEALRGGGGRAVFAHGNPGDAADARRVRDELGTGGLVTMALSFAGPEFMPLDAAMPDILLARELGVMATMHVGCGTNGPRARAVSGLADAGALGPDLNFVHCNTISDAEVALIVESGATVSITAFVETLMGHGTPAFARFLKAGGDPSLGIDVAVACGPDLFGQMRSALSVSRLADNQRLLDGGEDPGEVWPRAREVLHAATLAGARAVGLGDEVGSLTVGKAADIVLLDGTGLPSDPAELAGAIVTLGDISRVDSVLVAGRFVKRDGRMLHHDLRALREQAAAVNRVA